MVVVVAVVAAAVAVAGVGVGQTGGCHVAVYICRGTRTVQETCTAMILLQRIQTATNLIQVRGHWIKLQHCIDTVRHVHSFFFRIDIESVINADFNYNLSSPVFIINKIQITIHTFTRCTS